MPPVAPRTLLECTGLTFAYGQRPVVRDVSLSARSGEIVALLGPNGCGKSTLLKLAMGNLRGAGQVRWEGKDVKEYSRRDLATRVGYLPQHPEWTPGQTVLEAVAMGRFARLGMLGIESERDERIARESAMAMGLEDQLGRRVEDLSGGQRQRVFLARCLAQEPTAVLLDEPDTYLDLKHAALLAKVLRRLARERNIAVVMASHDLHLAASLADRLVLMADGQVMAEGPPRAVLTDAKVKAAYGVDAVVWEADGGAGAGGMREKMWGIGVAY